MTTRRNLVAELVQVGTGDGLLARRPDGVLFVDDSAVASRPTMIGAFIAAGSGSEALDAVLRVAADEELHVGAFAIVTWHSSVHVVVFGDIALSTDIPSLPRLSGTGHGTWVEHRAPRPPERCEVRLGTSTTPGTDLIAGVAPAGAFRVVLALGAGVAPPNDPPADTTAADQPPADTTAAMPVPHRVDDEGIATTPPWTAPPAASWDVLRDAGGGWMEESLQLSDGVRALRDAQQPSTTPVADTKPADTGAGGGRVEAPDLDADLRSGGDDRGGGDAPDGGFDPEVTLDPRRVEPPAVLHPAPALPDALPRLVQARRCELGHLNPPLRTECRTCARYIPPATPVETVAQPPLATLLLTDGRTVDVTGSLVLGRQPSVASARLDEHGELVIIDGDLSVSRTHVVIGVDGWTLLATDCGATAGTAIAPAGAEPVLLEPWVPHEITPDTTLFLGGRTQVRIVAPR